MTRSDRCAGCTAVKPPSPRGRWQLIREPEIEVKVLRVKDGRVHWVFVGEPKEPESPQAFIGEES